MFTGSNTGRIIDLTSLKRFTRMHNQYVINNCPKDKLLVWKLEDGWEPVAKFLGKPVPKGPLPHKNRLGGVIQDLENSVDYQVENRSRQTNLSFCGVI
jgi:hypothetical protein